MNLILILLVVGFFLVLGWLVATWYHADDHPVLAPAKEGRVTFKAVVQNALRDVRETAAPFFGWARRLWLFWGPRVTNTVGVAILSLDGLIASTPELKAAIMASPYGLPIILGVNLLVTLAPRSAPDRIPAPPAAGIMGPGAAAELARA